MCYFSEINIVEKKLLTIAFFKGFGTILVEREREREREREIEREMSLDTLCL
jgi:hypothetical protein